MSHAHIERGPGRSKHPVGRRYRRGLSENDTKWEFQGQLEYLQPHQLFDRAPKTQEVRVIADFRNSQPPPI